MRERCRIWLATAAARSGPEHGAAAARLQHGAGELLAVGLLGEEADGARLDRAVHELLVVERREHEDARRQVVGGDGRHDGEAVDAGQPQVEQHDVRAQRADLVERRAPVRRLTDHLQLGPGGDGAGRPVAEQRMVVGDQDADAVHVVILDGGCIVQKAGSA